MKTQSADQVQSNSEQDLKASLEAFETSLTTPVVSGDLDEWMEHVQKTWSEASAQIHYHIKHLHPRQYDEISKEDPSLLPRVELLKAEDTAIEQEREKLNQTFVRMAEHVPKLEPDEGKAMRHMEKVVSEGVAFVARVRKQRVAVQTWYSEAFNRGRGAVD